jgi:hypothetical protein
VGEQVRADRAQRHHRRDAAVAERAVQRSAHSGRGAVAGTRREQRDLAGPEEALDLALERRDLRLETGGFLVKHEGDAGGRRLGRERGRQAERQGDDREQQAPP